jgi:hypothetical protein
MKLGVWRKGAGWRQRAKRGLPGFVVWLAVATVLHTLPLHAYVVGPMPWIRLAQSSAVGRYAASKISTTTRGAGEQARGPRVGTGYTPVRDLSVCRAKKKPQAEDDDGEALKLELDRKLRKEVGEAKYQELVDAAEQVIKAICCVTRCHVFWGEGTRVIHGAVPGWLAQAGL